MERQVIGYVPRCLAHDVHKLLNCDFIHLNVLHANLNAPLQNRVLCEMRACWPEGP